LTDLQTRESSLLCTGEHPILQLALHDDSIWIASTDSSVHRWPAEGYDPQKIFQRGNSFLAGNLSFSRARVSIEGSTPVCYVYFWKKNHYITFLLLYLQLFMLLFVLIIPVAMYMYRWSMLVYIFFISTSVGEYDGVCFLNKFLLNIYIYIYI